MLSTLRWAGEAANVNSFADPNASFDPTLPCVSGEEAARDSLVYADTPKKLIERLEAKPLSFQPVSTAKFELGRKCSSTVVDDRSKTPYGFHPLGRLATPG